MKYYKDYKNWNKLKEILDKVDILLPFTEGEIWWVSFGVNIGIEIDGKGDNFVRPAIIIRKLNKEHAWVVPLTGSELVKSHLGVLVVHDLLNSPSFAIATQLQTMSNKRFIRKIGSLSIEQFKTVIDSIRKILPTI